MSEQERNSLASGALLTLRLSVLLFVYHLGALCMSLAKRKGMACFSLPFFVALGLSLALLSSERWGFVDVYVSRCDTQGNASG